MSAASLQSRQKARDELHRALETMEYVAFEQIMKRLLYQSGYLSVHLNGRKHKRGRTARGGLDMTARSVTELSSSLAIAQVKQYQRVVSRRFVDELRGAMLRLGAEQGLLLTLSKFSKVAHLAASESNVAPITLIEGEEVLDLLFAYRIGVMESNGVWRLDAKYLDFLQENAIGRYRTKLDTESDLQVKSQGKAIGQGKEKNQSKSKNQRKPRPPFCRLSPLDTPAVSQPSNPSHPSNDDLRPTSTKDNRDQGDEMTGSTHIMFGLNALWLLEALRLLEVLPGAANENIALLAGAAAFGSLLPDLDASQSKIKHLKIGGIKPFYLPATAIYRQLGHRSLLHSLWGLAYIALAGALLSPLIGWKTALALWLGYASHLLADAMTKSGIPLLYPKSKRFHLLPKGWRITTGSLAEETIFVLLSLSLFALLLRHMGL